MAGNHSETDAGEGEGRFMFVNGGPLGDFTTFDVNLSYRINESLRWNLAATNLFDSKLRQAVGSPDIRRLVVTELKYTIR